MACCWIEWTRVLCCQCQYSKPHGVWQEYLPGGWTLLWWPLAHHTREGVLPAINAENSLCNLINNSMDSFSWHVWKSGNLFKLPISKRVKQQEHCHLVDNVVSAWINAEHCKKIYILRYVLIIAAWLFILMWMWNIYLIQVVFNLCMQFLRGLLVGALFSFVLMSFPYSRKLQKKTYIFFIQLWGFPSDNADVKAPRMFHSCDCVVCCMVLIFAYYTVYSGVE